MCLMTMSWQCHMTVMYNLPCFLTAGLFKLLVLPWSVTKKLSPACATSRARKKKRGGRKRKKYEALVLRTLLLASSRAFAPRVGSTEKLGL